VALVASLLERTAFTTEASGSLGAHLAAAKDEREQHGDRVSTRPLTQLLQ
jgi:hypothetical protein